MSGLERALSRLQFRRHTLRVQLTLLYSGLAIALLAIALAASGLLVRSAETALPSPGGVSKTSSVIDVHHFGVGATVIFVVVAALGLVLSWWLAARFLEPLRTITATARRISASNLHERLHLERADDELGQLGSTLDDLFGRLEASFESQRHFVANASHELRTPLAGQRTLLQVALADPDATGESLRATCEQALLVGAQQERLIDALLLLARSERGLERRVVVDLEEITEHALELRSEEAQRRGLQIGANIAPAPLLGDPGLIDSLVSNLIDNALRHNVAGGSVHVATRSEAGGTRLSMSNTGPVIAVEEVDRLFVPFQQLGAERVRRAGHGLGLAIVRAISEAHGARLSARPRSEGGLEIEVDFP